MECITLHLVRKPKYNDPFVPVLLQELSKQRAYTCFHERLPIGPTGLLKSQPTRTSEHSDPPREVSHPYKTELIALQKG